MRSAAIAITAALTFTQAQADVTPDDVWLAWQNLAQSQGQTLTATSTETEGDTLTLSGLSLSLTNSFGPGSATLPDIALTDNGDGTVDIGIPENFTITVSRPPESATGSPSQSDLTFTLPGAEITASGLPDAINYAKSLPELGLTAKGEDGTEATLKMTGVTGSYATEAGESAQILNGAFASKTLNLTASGPSGNDAADVKLSLDALDGKIELTGLPDDPAADMTTALNNGLTFDGTLSYGIGSLDISGTESGQPIKLAGTLGGGSLTLGFDAAKFHADALNKALALNVAGTDEASGDAFTFAGAMADYSTTLDIQGRGWSDGGEFNAALKSGLIMAATGAVGATNLDFAGGPADKPVKFKGSLAGIQTSFALSAGQITSDLDAKAISFALAAPEIPVPELSLSLGQLAFALVMPAAQSTTPAPFSYLTRIVDLKLPDTIWALIDPTAALPRDPATLIIDTKGTATLTQNLMDDPAALEGEDVPGQLNSLDIPQILLRAAGAEITAMGAFTFDNSDTTTFDGMPAPTGKIDIKATGLNALIYKLVAIGLLPEEQAMQGRMALSMFANTSTSVDEITSVLEFKDKGFYANGQQLQ